MLPTSVLFLCNFNAVRSPMAEGILKLLMGKKIYVDSAGINCGELDGLAIEVMDEIGVNINKHRPKDLDELLDYSYDMIISLTPMAHHKAVEFTRIRDIEIEYWPTNDPTIVEGSREQRLDAYRAVRDELYDIIIKKFYKPPSPNA